MGTTPKKSQHQQAVDFSTSRSSNSEPVKAKRSSSRQWPIISNRTLGKFLGPSRNVFQFSPHASHGSATRLPRSLKTGVENSSGISMDDVRVHYNSAKPAKVGALAHTHGKDIYLGPGQERHLPHEAWHVVQQTQGRAPTTHVLNKSIPLNENRELENDADKMGARALQTGNTVNKRSLRSASVPAPVVQRVKVPNTVGANDHGQFETTKFQPLNDSGVSIILKFHPNKNKADAKKIGLVQSVKAINPVGTAYAVNPTIANRMVGSGNAAGFAIDNSGKTNNPLYFDTKNLAANQSLKDTPDSNVRGTATPQVGSNTHYELGYSYKINATDAERTTHSAGISDGPEGIKKKGAGMNFETAALALDGVDAGKYYGSVKWGYTVGGTDAAPKVEAANTSDISEASKGTPTANFIEAAKAWNTGKTQGTLEVSPPDTTQADAWVQYVQGTGPGRVARGTKLKLQRVIKGTTGGMIEAEILKADGTGSGNVVNIYVADVKDKGDGSANKPLPIPQS
jgi:hypothetical protein